MVSGACGWGKSFSAPNRQEAKKDRNGPEITCPQDLHPVTYFFQIGATF